MASRRLPWAFLDDYRGRAFAGEWPTLCELFAITAERFPDRPAFTAYDPERRSLSYREAREKARGVAALLVRNGVAKGDKVALTGKNRPEWAVAYMGILEAGAVVVPIDYQLRRDEIENILRASDSAALFVDEEKHDDFDAAALGLAGKWSLQAGKGAYLYDAVPAAVPANLPAAAEGDLAAILYTSGTTGVPKGVMLTHGNFVADCFLAQGNLDIFHTDVFYALLPIHHSYTMLAVFIEAISVGAEVVFGSRMVTSQILRDLKEAKITMFLGVPLLFNKLLSGIMRGVRQKGVLVYGLIRALMGLSGFIKKAFKVNPGKKLFRSVLDKASLATIRICISGGGPLAPSVFRRYNQLGIDFIQGYGLTETAPILTLNPKEKYKESSVGRLSPRVEAKVLAPDERGVGEIAVRGPMVMQGYYKAPEETAKVFTSDGWFKTGDMGWIDEEGYVYLTGRLKSMIVTEGGKNVYPEEIEYAFQLHEEIDQILVRGYVLDKKMKSEGIEALVHPDPAYFEALGKREGRAYGKAEIEERVHAIISEVNASLLPYQRINRAVILDEAMEMTTTRKIKRHALAR